MATVSIQRPLEAAGTHGWGLWVLWRWQHQGTWPGWKRRFLRGVACPERQFLRGVVWLEEVAPGWGLIGRGGPQGAVAWVSLFLPSFP